MEAPGRLPLVSGTLGAEPNHPRAQGPELRVVTPEGARLRRTAAGARDLVPAPWQAAAGPARHRVAVNDGTARKGRKVYGHSRRGHQGHGGRSIPDSWS